MLNLFKALLVALTTLSFTAATAVEWKTAPSQSVFPYKWCSTLDDFGVRMETYSGKLVGSGAVPNGQVSLVVFPDTSFGIFIYNTEDNSVCVIDTGWLVPSVPGDLV